MQQGIDANVSYLYCMLCIDESFNINNKIKMLFCETNVQYMNQYIHMHILKYKSNQATKIYSLGHLVFK